MLQSAVEHYQRQQRIVAAGLLAARKGRRLGSAEVARILASFQLLAARDAAESVPLMLAEQNIDSDPVGSVAISSLAGTASDGRSLQGLFDQASTDLAFDLMVATQLQDAARGAASVAMVSNYAVDGYVRMLNPPSCSRCAVLAGKWFRWNDGFQRHPKCDCRHIPSSENIAGDLRTDPGAYFDSLPTAKALNEQYPELTVRMRNELGIYSQEDIFTKAGAQAIHMGADMGQVVNARLGMSVAQIGRRPVLVSTTGTTKRGLASRKRTGRNMSARVMPETIFQVATSREDAIRLLKLNGFIF